MAIANHVHVLVHIRRKGILDLFKRILAVLVLEILLATAIGFYPVQAQTAKELQATEKARASVLKLGVGRTSRVEVKLRDQTKLKGYISDAGQNSFTLNDLNSTTSQTIAYSDVTDVRKPGGGLSTRSWVIIGAAAATAVIVGIALKPAVCDGGAQTRFPC